MLRPYRSVLPRVHATAFIDENAQVIGDVEVGEESQIALPKTAVRQSPGVAILTTWFVATSYAERQRREVQVAGVGPRDTKR